MFTIVINNCKYPEKFVKQLCYEYGCTAVLHAPGMYEIKSDDPKNFFRLGMAWQKHLSLLAA